ncbi:MAG: sulfite exporter TauE/SafE family protein [Planctomycetes bacterium]|nr:sulfite exporter TauE/SafE family protein [Planctomycetota bacterium]
MTATLTAVLVASLLGSLHCAGMCGALVAFAVGGAEPRSLGARAVLHVAYHGGRMLTYGVLGGVAGLLGAALDLGASMVGVNRAAAILAGLTMIGVGAVAALRHRGVSLPRWPVPAWMQRILVAGQRAALGLRPLPRALTIGLLTALLPCGWLYAFAVIAAGTGSAVGGAAIMLAFWAGTVPVLASLGVAVQTLTGTVGRRVPMATAMLLVILGLGTVAERFALSGESLVAPVASSPSQDTLQQVEQAGQEVPACCRHRLKAALPADGRGR